MGPGGLEQLAYQLSAQLLSHQESALDEVRARTGTLLAASALVASFLGAQAIEKTGLSALTVLALAAFVASTLPSVYVLLPKRNVVFALRGSVLFETEFAEGSETAATYRHLTYWAEDAYDANRAAVRRIAKAYRVAAFALVLEILFWTTELLR